MKEKKAAVSAKKDMKIETNELAWEFSLKLEIRKIRVTIFVSYLIRYLSIVFKFKNVMKCHKM